MNVGNDGACKFQCCRLTTHILGSYLAIVQDLIDGTLYHFAVGGQVDVTQHFGAAQQHGSGIGNVFANSLGECVTCTLKA